MEIVFERISIFLYRLMFKRKGASLVMTEILPTLRYALVDEQQHKSLE